MPQEVDDKVDAIVDSCLEKGDKDKKECEQLAWAIVNSEKSNEDNKSTEG